MRGPGVYKENSVRNSGLKGLGCEAHAAQNKSIVLVPGEGPLNTGPNGACIPVLTYADPGVVMGTWPAKGNHQLSRLAFKSRFQFHIRRSSCSCFLLPRSAKVAIGNLSRPTEGSAVPWLARHCCLCPGRFAWVGHWAAREHPALKSLLTLFTSISESTVLKINGEKVSERELNQISRYGGVNHPKLTL